MILTLLSDNGIPSWLVFSVHSSLGSGLNTDELIILAHHLSHDVLSYTCRSVDPILPLGELKLYTSSHKV